MSLLESLWITCIEILTALFLSASISIFLGWTFTKNNRTTQISKLIFRLLIYSIVILPTIFFLLISGFSQYKMPILAIAVFLCSLVCITLYAILGFEQARQNQNQWYLSIPNISLGIRVGLLLSWPALQIETLNSNKGISFFIWDAFNSGDTGGIAAGAFSAITLAFMLDQTIDVSSLLLSKALNPHPSNHISS